MAIMRKVTIDEAPVGGILAEDCLATDGTLLLPRERSLTAPIIQRLKKLGIKILSLQPDQTDENKVPDPDRELQIADIRFSRFSNNPYYCAIREALVEWLEEGGANRTKAS